MVGMTARRIARCAAVLARGAVVLVDTMFFAAVAPLLPHYSDELDCRRPRPAILTAAYPAGTFVGALPSGGSPRAGA
jgi:hypothetical protein